MPKTASLNIRLDENVKKAAESVFSRYGLSPPVDRHSDLIGTFIVKELKSRGGA